MGEIAHTPGHDGDFRVGEAAQAGLVKVVVVGVGQEDKVDLGQMLYLQSATLDTL